MYAWYQSAYMRLGHKFHYIRSYQTITSNVNSIKTDSTEKVVKCKTDNRRSVGVFPCPRQIFLLIIDAN
jgi:hypothetical protein